ncbi:MAG: lipoate--protein ligase family protein [Richelia sp. RM2_1_2]|nr:lipoate--protein ligase family protein [Richelia sp. SM1_7_0]NJN09650.1 lipoate--protein ligase family protein [Richelia sp. RM1_1_1]NJO27959.1 lipoate--protein ligase family protein [Richelia sp. SL_2_1]NJO57242.1 lipoate--protein ligase family protein [Richelia sp. RM2_1_2]
MAIDQWLLQKHQSGHPSSLRFYTWSPSAISLGYHQRKYSQDWQNLIWKNEQIDLIRRPTGGRAVLHHGDLTYAVVTSGLPGSRMEMYQKICEFLIKGWQNLGIELDYGIAGRGYINNPNCFGTATVADLVTVDGIKLIGSAQLRRGNVVLQHGSMSLKPDIELFKQVFGEDLDRVVVGENLAIERVIAALIDAAQKCFGVKFEEKALSNHEWEEIFGIVESQS